MVRIAVCDDEFISLELNVLLLENYIAEKGEEAVISRFRTPLELLKACEEKPFQVYLLDMIMPEMNGIELGKRVREKDQDAQIVFLTSDRESALEAYDVNPLHYLIKPVEPENLSRVMDLALSKISPVERSITIKAKNGIFEVRVSEIVCVEHTQRTAEYTLADRSVIESITLSSSFSELAKTFGSEDGFLSPHNSFVLNMNYVQSLEAEGFVMKTGQYIPVAVRKRAAVKAAYLEFCQKKNKGASKNAPKTL